MEEKVLIKFRNIVKEFDGTIVLKSINLDIHENEFVTLLGPSGCGKTTLLRILGGFLEADEGAVIFDNEDIKDLPPYKRELNTVFQKYALFPHMNVFDNIAFGLKIKKMSKDVIDQKVMRMLKLIGLEGFENKNVTTLSGGQQQRIAIARALVNEPKVLLLDEPLGALDLKLRKEMQYELKRIQQEVGITFIYVTHDQVEAMTMADRIVVMKDGVIQQIGSPIKLYNEPVNKFVAGFIGSPQMNFIEVNVKDDVDYYYLEVPDISPQTGTITNIRRVKGRDIGDSFHKFYTGDILFTRINPRISRVAIAPELKEYGIVSKEVYRIVYKDNTYINEKNKYVICALLQNENVIKQIVRLSTGSSSSRARVQVEDLLNDVYIPILSEMSQKQISDSIYKMSKEIWDQSQKLLETYQKNQELLGSKIDINEFRGI